MPSSTIERPTPDVVVRHLLVQEPAGPAAPRSTSRFVARRTASLQARAPQIVQRAAIAGVDIQYLGINPLFAEPRLYAGAETDWILGPADQAQDAVVPQRERRSLERLRASDLDFPWIFVAHEVP